MGSLKLSTVLLVVLISIVINQILESEANNSANNRLGKKMSSGSTLKVKGGRKSFDSGGNGRKIRTTQRIRTTTRRTRRTTTRTTRRTTTKPRTTHPPHKVRTTKKTPSNPDHFFYSSTPKYIPHEVNHYDPHFATAKPFDPHFDPASVIRNFENGNTDPSKLLPDLPFDPSADLIDDPGYNGGITMDPTLHNIQNPIINKNNNNNLINTIVGEISQATDSKEAIQMENKIREFLAENLKINKSKIFVEDETLGNSKNKYKHTFPIKISGPKSQECMATLTKMGAKISDDIQTTCDDMASYSSTFSPTGGHNTGGNVYPVNNGDGPYRNRGSAVDDSPVDDDPDDSDNTDDPDDIDNTGDPDDIDNTGDPDDSDNTNDPDDSDDTDEPLTSDTPVDPSFDPDLPLNPATENKQPKRI